MRHPEPTAAPVPYNRPFFDRRDFQKLVEPLRCGWLGQGRQVARFEQMVAQSVGAAHAVAASSGTAALRLALLAAGIGPGQEVLLPAFASVATAAAVEHCGARPVFCDTDPDTLAIDPPEIRSRASAATTLVVAVHPFGRSADMAALREACRARRLPMIEDCGGGLGAHHSTGHVGTLGLAGCFQFDSASPITTGEGGMVVTNRRELADTVRLLRGDGTREGDGSGPLAAEPALPGRALQMTDLQAAVGVSQMEKLPEILAERRLLALGYDDLLEPLDWLRRPQAVPAGASHSYTAYVCLVAATAFSSPEAAGEFRDHLLAELARAGIECRQPARALPTIRYYRSRYRLEPQAFPNALAADRLALALPLYVGMSEGEQQRVVQGLAEARERVLAEGEGGGEAEALGTAA